MLKELRLITKGDNHFGLIATGSECSPLGIRMRSIDRKSALEFGSKDVWSGRLRAAAAEGEKKALEAQLLETEAERDELSHQLSEALMDEVGLRKVREASIYRCDRGTERGMPEGKTQITMHKASMGSFFRRAPTVHRYAVCCSPDASGR